MGGIGSRVRAQREAAGLSRAKLALAIGIRENALAKIETGENTPGFLTGLKLARELKADPWFLAYGEAGPDITQQSGDVEETESRLPEAVESLRLELEQTNARQEAVAAEVLRRLQELEARVGADKPRGRRAG